MKRRNKAQWQSLIQEFERSGLSQAKFCAQQGLNAKYFSLRRAKLKANAARGAFSEALPAQLTASGAASIQYGRITVQLHAAPAQQIVELAKALG